MKQLKLKNRSITGLFSQNLKSPMWDLKGNKGFCSGRWGSSLSGLRTLDPPLGPPSTRAKICQCTYLKKMLCLKSYYFCKLGSHAKFHNPMITTSGRKVTGPERRGKNAVNSGLYILPAMRSICDIKTGD